MGIGFLLVSTFTDSLRTSVDNGFPDGVETYGLVSGLWASIFAFGAFVGPSISGYLFDHFGFRNSVYFIIILHVIVAVSFALYLIFSKSPRKMYKPIGVEDRAMARSTQSIARLSRSSSSVSFPTNIPTVLPSVVMASSISKTHWQQNEKANMALLKGDDRDDTYGAMRWNSEIDVNRETIA